MNRRKSKLLMKAASAMSSKGSVLTWNGRGTKVYPAKSARAIYQRLKKEARDPVRYAEIRAYLEKSQRSAEAVRRVSEAGKSGAQAGKQLREQVEEQPFHM